MVCETKNNQMTLSVKLVLFQAFLKISDLIAAKNIFY